MVVMVLLVVPARPASTGWHILLHCHLISLRENFIAGGCDGRAPMGGKYVLARGDGEGVSVWPTLEPVPVPGGHLPIIP